MDVPSCPLGRPHQILSLLDSSKRVPWVLNLLTVNPDFWNPKNFQDSAKADSESSMQASHYGIAFDLDESQSNTSHSHPSQSQAV